jgi:hypothetical protein
LGKNFDKSWLRKAVIFVNAKKIPQTPAGISQTIFLFFVKYFIMNSPKQSQTFYKKASTVLFQSEF